MYGHEVVPLSEKLNDIYRMLPENAALLYRGIGVCSILEIDIDIAAAILGCDLEQAAQSLAELANVNLLENKADSRYRVLPIVIAHACGLAKTYDSETHQLSVVVRVGEALLHWLREANTMLGRELPDYSLEFPPACRQESLKNDPAAAVEWIRQTHETVILAAETILMRTNKPQLADILASALWLFQLYRKDSELSRRLENIRARAAKSWADPRALRRVARRRGMAALKNGNYRKAEADFARFAELSANATDPKAAEDQLSALVCQGMLLHARGEQTGSQYDLAQALSNFDRAVKEYAEIRDTRKEGIARDFRARVYLVLNQPQQALADAEQAQVLLRSGVVDGYNLARTYITEGQARLALGEYALASTTLDKAAVTLANLGAFDELARAYRALGQCATAVGDYHNATSYLRDAHELLAHESSAFFQSNAIA